jgi:hypothetical protein
MALLLLVLLGLAGTWLVSLRVAETSHPSTAWFAWGITLIGAAFEVYSGWWNAFLRATNQVVPAGRIFFLGYAVRLALACAFLLAGAGLLSIPIAILASSALIRAPSRRACLDLMSGHPQPLPAREEVISLVGKLWPTSWRAGLQLSTTCIAGLVNTFVIVQVFHLSGNAEYGLSLQIASFINAMSQVWVAVKWPLVGQLRARHDHAALRRLLQPRVRLMTLTFFVLAVAAYFVGPQALRWIGSGKRILPPLWFLLLLVNTFLECQFAFWTTMFSMENRIPSLWPTVITTSVSLITAVVLVHVTRLGLGCFVLAPLACGSVFNYWYWALVGARNLKTNWLRFTFSRNPGPV